MPWEIRIIHGSGDESKPLGEREEVIKTIEEALPDVTLRQPPIPPEKVLNKMPPFVREAMLRPRLEAIFEAENYIIQFYASSDDVLFCIDADVRGNGDPLSALAAVCRRHNWCVIDVATKTRIDINAAVATPAWQKFCDWRDKAIKQIRDKDANA